MNDGSEWWRQRIAELNRENAVHNRRAPGNGIAIHPNGSEDGGLTEQSPFRVTMFGDIESMPSKRWLVPGWIGAGDFVALFGAPGSGKSVFAGDLACALAAKESWFGKQLNGGAVLYVAAERAAVVKRRMAAWRSYSGMDNLPLAVLAGSVDFVSSRNHADWVIKHAIDLQAASGLQVVAIVIDTVSRVLSGGDENSSKDMGALIGALGEIQDATGAAIIAVHHIPADGQQRLRGHGALLGACDVTIGVEKTGDTRTATICKSNDGEEGLAVAFKLESVELGTDEATGETTTAPIVVALECGAVAASRPARRLTHRQTLALTALHRVVVDRGVPPPISFGLPASVASVANVADWREELGRIGVISADSTNPRQDFRRIKEALQASRLITVRDQFVWAL